MLSKLFKFLKLTKDEEKQMMRERRTEDDMQKKRNK